MRVGTALATGRPLPVAERVDWEVDVVLTGMPWGCGEFMVPQRSLGNGDVVEVDVDGIGVLRNEVVEVS